MDQCWSRACPVVPMESDHPFQIPMGAAGAGKRRGIADFAGLVQNPSRTSPMKSQLFALFVALFLPFAVVAAESARVPTAQEILDRYVEASGGREALGKVKSRIMKGTIEVTALGASGQFTVRNKVPNKQVTGFDFSGFGSVREGYDGAVAWSALPLQGVKKKTGGELARAQRSTVFPRELKLKDSYERVEAKGAGKVGLLDAWVLEGVVKDGKPDRLYFDQKSGLLLREEAVVVTAAGEMMFQIDFEDYRVVDGVQVAYVMKVPQPAQIGFRIKFDEVKINVEIADSEFAEPKE